jgi:hypothetical protein
MSLYNVSHDIHKKTHLRLQLLDVTSACRETDASSHNTLTTYVIRVAPAYTYGCAAKIWKSMVELTGLTN